MWTFIAAFSKASLLPEIELTHESQELNLPRWIGREVTGDSDFRKINMRACLKRSSQKLVPIPDWVSP
jgi:CYTH domain-containing protein